MDQGSERIVHGDGIREDGGNIGIEHNDVRLGGIARSMFSTHPTGEVILGADAITVPRSRWFAR